MGNRPVMSIVLECDGFQLSIVCDPLAEISYMYIYVYTHMYIYIYMYMYVYIVLLDAGCSWIF